MPPVSASLSHHQLHIIPEPERPGSGNHCQHQPGHCSLSLGPDTTAACPGGFHQQRAGLFCPIFNTEKYRTFPTGIQQSSRCNIRLNGCTISDNTKSNLIGNTRAVSSKVRYCRTIKVNSPFIAGLNANRPCPCKDIVPAVILTVVVVPDAFIPVVRLALSPPLRTRFPELLIVVTSCVALAISPTPPS